MKYIKKILLISIVISTISFVSCKKDTVLSSAILTINNQTGNTLRDSVFAGDIFSIKGSIGYAGKIQRVQFFRSYPDSSSFAGDEFEIAGSAITSFDTSVAKTFSFTDSVYNIRGNTNIRVQVTDQDGHTVSTIITITIRTSNINTVNNIQLGGWDSNYGSCLDADAGVAYSSSALDNPTLKNLIDVFFDNSTLANVNLDDNNTIISTTKFARTNFTTADFDSMKADDLFKNLTASLDQVQITVGNVIFYQTAAGKKGLIEISSLTSPTGDLLINLKVQK
jgi:hypothetical protein